MTVTTSPALLVMTLTGEVIEPEEVIADADVIVTTVGPVAAGFVVFATEGGPGRVGMTLIVEVIPPPPLPFPPPPPPLPLSPLSPVVPLVGPPGLKVAVTVVTPVTVRVTGCVVCS